MKKKTEKTDREAQREHETLMMKQLEADNKKWAPVDKDDARHL